MAEGDRPETKRLVLGSAICRAGGAPAGGAGMNGKFEEVVEFVQNSRRKPRGAAATAVLIAMAAGLS